MSQKFTNNATALITSNITTGSLSFTIESAFADRYPALVSGDWFVGTLQNIAGDIEVIRVNKRDVGSNAIQDVVRAQEGTKALTFSAGEAVFSVRATAAHHQDTVNHIASTAGAHAASAVAFSPTADISAVTVQAAIEEVRADAVALDAAQTLVVAAKVSIADLVAQTHTALTTSGTSPAFVATPAAPLTAYAPFQRFQIKAHAAGGLVNTVNFSGLGAKSIKQYDSSGAKVDAVFVINQVMDMVYDGTDFVVFNAPGYSEPAGDYHLSASPTQPPGTRRILVQGQPVLRATYPTLDFLWCGSTLNNHVDPLQKADFYYRCTDPLNPSTTRSDAGAYMVLPPAGYFPRPINTGSTGADASRARFKLQEDDNKAHTHTYQAELTPTSMYISTEIGYRGRDTGTTSSSGGAEARPKNFAGYLWLSY